MPPQDDVEVSHPRSRINWKWLTIWLVVLTAATSTYYYFFLGLPLMENLVLYLLTPLGITFVILLRGACDYATSGAILARDKSESSDEDFST
jgi:hypothetical protein